MPDRTFSPVELPEKGEFRGIHCKGIKEEINHGIKRKKSSGFRSRKKRYGAADLLNAVGACPVLYDGNADLDKESVLHKISRSYDFPSMQEICRREVQESLDLVVLSPGVPTDLPIVEEFL